MPGTHVRHIAHHQNTPMFPKPPKFVFNNKPDVVQVVQQQKSAAGPMDPHVLIVNHVGTTKKIDPQQRSVKKHRT